MNNVKLSIIIPVFNNFKQLEKCLKSLNKQSFQDFEVIVVDDGSSLLSRGVLAETFNSFGEDASGERLGVLESGIKFYHIQHAGAPAARNFGFAKSSGEYVFFCDADIVFLKKDSLQKFVDTLDKNPDIDFACSQFKFGWKKFKCVEFDVEKLKQNNYISGNSIIRCSALEKISRDKPWDENLKRFQDWDLWLSLIEKGSRGKLIKEVLWQANAGGTMSKWLPGVKFNFYKMFPNTKSVQEFEQAKEIIKKKHNIK